MEADPVHLDAEFVEHQAGDHRGISQNSVDRRRECHAVIGKRPDIDLMYGIVLDMLHHDRLALMIEDLLSDHCPIVQCGTYLDQLSSRI